VKDSGELRADALEAHEHRSRCVVGLGCHERVALRLDGFDLIHQQLEPVEFTVDLRLEVLRDRSAIAGTQFLQLFEAVATYRLVTGDALPKEQALDAIDVPRSFGDENLALAGDPAPVFRLRARHSHHGADTGLAALVRQRRSHKRLAIDLIGLGAPDADARSLSKPDRRHGFRYSPCSSTRWIQKPSRSAS
jgi:hypothetical protein